MMHQGVDGPAGVATEVHPVRFSWHSPIDRRADTLGRRSPRALSGRRRRLRTAGPTSLHRKLEVICGPAIRATQNRPRFDDGLHLLGVATDVRVVAAREGTERGADLRAISFLRYVQNCVVIGHVIDGTRAVVRRPSAKRASDPMTFSPGRPDTAAGPTRALRPSSGARAACAIPFPRRPCIPPVRVP